MRVKGSLMQTASYGMFSVCSTSVGGHAHRGVRVTCSYCEATETIAVNTFAHGRDDDEKIERIIARKFEKIGWKIGTNAKQNLCPPCFVRVKQAAQRKSQEKNNMVNKVVPLNGAAAAAAAPAERVMTREDRRIIWTKLSEVYLNETTGYTPGWHDARVANDLGVPLAWIVELREQNFGPAVGERMTTLLAEAREVLGEIKATGDIEPVVRRLQDLIDRARRIEEQLRELGHAS